MLACIIAQLIFGDSFLCNLFLFLMVPKFLFLLLLLFSFVLFLFFVYLFVCMFVLLFFAFVVSLVGHLPLVARVFSLVLFQCVFACLYSFPVRFACEKV